MLEYESRAKYIAETISIIVPFDDLFVGGETITGIPTITVTVFSGDDTNPSHILYEGASILNNVSVEQRIRLGIEGVIYLLTYSVQTTSSNIYEKEVYLAILPTVGTAIPVINKQYLSSTLYPYEYMESLQGAANITGGRLYQELWTTSESLGIGTVTLTSGSLVVALVTYSNTYESLQGSISLIGGNLADAGITYSNGYESLRGAFALIGGTLNNTGITYSNEVESLTSSVTLTGGTLA